MPTIDGFEDLTTWDEAWTKDAKPRDELRPFHRINSPAYDETMKKQAVGNGYDCGCRNPDHDYETSVTEVITTVILQIGLNILGLGTAALIRYVKEQLLRTLPGWVPVQREQEKDRSKWRTLVEEEKEVEGLLVRSFQTWTDVPLYQWHRFYDWNFHIIPAKGYKYIVGKGNLLDTAKDEKLPVVDTGNHKRLECEWDCGAFSNLESPRGNTSSLNQPGPMYNHTDWAWPMAGQYIWISGRWIYDCGHEREDLFKTELHPCKALASARWEAVKFDEHEHFSPAIQFMFFACRHGGYIDFPTLNKQNYEFILDLPKLSSETFEFPIGHSPDFPLNTILVRPRLLMKVDYQPFSNAYGVIASAGMADPQVELLAPEEAGQLPSQDKVTIPLKNLAETTDSYGMILSLGWHDPGQAKRETTKKVIVSFTNIEVHEHHDFWITDSEVQIKFGVNGRWFSVYEGDFSARSKSLRLGKRVELHLNEDDYIAINCHGMEEDPVGAIMTEPANDRILKEDGRGRAYTWKGDIDQPDNFHASRVAADLLEKMISTLENQNDPLGIIDPGYKLRDGDSSNPIQVSKLMELTGGPGRVFRGFLTAHVTTVEDEQLRYTPTERDYVLKYTLEYHDQ